MTPRVVVYVSTHHDLVYTSLVLAGFCALADQGAVELTYREPRAGDAWLAADPMVVCFDVESQQSLRVALDQRDGEGVSFPIGDRVDRYLKRAYSRAERDRLDEPLRGKLAPFGLNFPCRTRASTWKLLGAIGVPLVLAGRAGISRLRQYLSTPPISAFERHPSMPVDPAIIFQTRLWRADEVPPNESEPINAERVAMVRALKKAFGNRFVGGLVPTPFAKDHYPDLITPHPSKIAAYLALRQRCLVSVYTRGLEHSLAFKLGETFAASQCLVSVPLRQELPRPLEDGRHCLFFNTTDECVAACTRLLEHPDLARDMRFANHDYYRDEVEPAAHIRRVLERLGVLPV